MKPNSHKTLLTLSYICQIANGNLYLMCPMWIPHTHTTQYYCLGELEGMFDGVQENIAGKKSVVTCHPKHVNVLWYFVHKVYEKICNTVQ